MHSKVSTSVIYNDLALHRQPPPWLNFVWNAFSVPRFAFTAWIILQQRLLTKDRMSHFGMTVNQTCVLCASADETHPHLFADCNFTRTIFSACPHVMYRSWNDFSNGRFILTNCTRIQRLTAYLYISICFYNIWKERNCRIFQNSRNSPTCLISRIKSTVRETLYSCKAFRTSVQADQTNVLLLY